MNLSDFDFSVPAELIAKHPLKNRDGCRLLALGKKTSQMAHSQFSNLLEYLHSGDVLVLNDAKVNKSRFFATRPTSPRGFRTGGGRVEVLLTRHIPDSVGANLQACPEPAEWVRPGESKDSPLRFSSLSLRRRGTEGEVVGTGLRACPGGEGQPQRVAPTNTQNVWEAIISHSSRVKEGEFLTLNGKGEGFKILSKGEGKAEVQVVAEEDIFEKYGTIPIPPYFERPAEKEDEEDYQTVFARTPGASAAPTAGLHFTPELLDKIKSIGVEIACLSLLVGPGTFEPIRGDDITQHKMHKEYFEIGEETCTKINAAKKSGKKIWAVGTTVVKALETAAPFVEAGPRACPGEGGRPQGVAPTNTNELHPFSGDSDLFIYPPFNFQIVDGLITNFHWPRSTLILLVAAFAGKDQILSAYHEAIANRYRFFSYGDAMLIY